MGRYTMMCHHTGGHETDPMIAPLSLQFFLAHPYKVSPDPYANGVPMGFPTYCANTLPRSRCRTISTAVRLISAEASGWGWSEICQRPRRESIWAVNRYRGPPTGRVLTVG
jgi:hypothetical protein